MQFHFVVHPHIRGAYTRINRCLEPDGGSSPHTWGIHGIIPESGAEFRFIPTYVGHTGAPAPARPRCPVHPHIRGAYGIPARRRARLTGSSPHTWGIPVPGGLVSRVQRFIPTYVGHTAKSARRWQASAVHPHIRGAYTVNQQKPILLDWFIPTYVGHTRSVVGGISRETVHPHIRGAYRFISALLAFLLGSSPHTWGIRFRNYQTSPRSRFIPTYVGHTVVVVPAGTPITVHPHIRGAYTGPP